MDILHSGFDGLDVTFQARIGVELSQMLASAKEEAAQGRQPVPINFRGVNMLVAESGSPGGYAYRCDTGKLGGNWFFSRHDSGQLWGVRFSSHSLPLAVFGLTTVRRNIEELLKDIGVAVPPDGVSIGRVDCAVDILAPGFILDPDNFIVHQRTSPQTCSESFDCRVYGSSRKTSFTVGKMPNRTVILYDKRAEVIKKRKVEMWELWNASRRTAGNAALDPTDAVSSAIWRAEFRAGKRHLYDHWKVRGWESLEARLGDIMSRMVHWARYVVPSDTDSNPARWPYHPLWAMVRDRIDSDLFDMRSGVDPEKLKQVIRAEHRNMLLGQIGGLSIPCAVADGYEPEDYGAALKRIGHDVQRRAAEHKVPLDERFDRVKGRLEFR